tara:strand:- start:1008 stop:1256 length:249 start_codon:yes stop_codon:yes gene_type:complete
MINYVKYIIFNFLCILDALVNFCGSLVTLHPRCDTATGFLTLVELRRVGRELESHLSTRYTEIGKANDMVKVAKTLVPEEEL